MALDPATEVLTYIAVLLLLAIFISYAAQRIKISNILILILAGLILGKLTFNGAPIFNFENTFLVSIAVLTLVMVVFDGASRFEFRVVDKLSFNAMKLTTVFLLLNVVIVSLFTVFLFFSGFTAEALLFAMLFSFVMSGTDPASVFTMMKGKANKVIETLELEAIINTPIIVIFPFLILDIVVNLGDTSVANAVVGQFLPLVQQIVVGIGSGVLIGLIAFRWMKKYYSQQLSHVALITTALLAYIIAENLQGNGVLAVATLAVIFGNSYVRGKGSMQAFNTMLAQSLTMLVFILIGFIVVIEYTPMFLIKSLLLYGILILTRMTAISITFKNSDFNAKEKIFMALSMPKGIAVAVVAFTFSMIPLRQVHEPFMMTILQLIIISMVYSLVLSTIVDKFSYHFIRVKLEDDK